MRTKDHVVPKSKGGIRTVEACLRCNAAKKDMSLEEFRKIRGVIEFWGEMKARLAGEDTAWLVADIDILQAPVAKMRDLHLNLNGINGNPPDLRGLKFGAFTVTHWLGRRGIGKNGKSSWEVVCMCGAKEYRTSRAVRNPANTFDACVECRKPVGKLRSDIFKEFGVDVTWEDCFYHLYGAYLGQEDGINDSDNGD